MTMFAGIPQELEVSVDPETIDELGPAVITATVSDASGPVENARVCLRQGDLAYGVKATGANGEATFEGFPVLDTTRVQVAAIHPDYLPAVETLSVTGPSFLAYDSHIIDDSEPGGDGDGRLEAAESGRLRVICRNRGDTNAYLASFYLRASPAVLYELKFNEEYRPKDIFIGKSGGNPPAVADTFRLPLSWEGLRAEGEPPPLIGGEDEHLFLYREESTGQYKIISHSPSESVDSVLTGILTTTGAFSNVSMTGESGTDQYYADGDSIWFSFRGDGSPDVLSFSAEAPDYLSIAWNPFAPKVTVAAGDTAGAWFDVDLTGMVPDGYNMVFSSAAKHDTTKWSYSDFVVPIGAPQVESVALDPVFGDLAAGCDTSVAFIPMIQNVGSDIADSVVVLLHKTGGTATVLDSVACFSAVRPESVAVATDSVLICGDSYAELEDLSYTLEVETHFLRHIEDYVAWDSEEGGGSDCDYPQTAPDGLVLDGTGRGYELRWNPVAGATSYLVYSYEDGDKRLLMRVTEATRATITHDASGERYERFGSQGELLEHQFVVTACDGSCCSPLFSSPSELETVWLPEQAGGWPKRVPDGLFTAPKIITIDSRDAVFLANRNIYAWFLDTGEPVIGANEDGLFFAPEFTGDGGEAFTATLAYASYYDPFETETNHLVLGNRGGDGLYAVKFEESGETYTSELFWRKEGIWSNLDAPVVLNMEWTDSIHNIPLVALCGFGRPDTLYVWLANGDPWTSPGVGSYGVYGIMPDTSSYNWRSLAVVPTDIGIRPDARLVQSTSKGHVMMWDYADQYYGSLVEPIWDVQLDTGPISSPVVGMLVPDMERYQIVVTNLTDQAGEEGKIWVLDSEDGSVLISDSDERWDFLSSAGGLAPRPALACMEDGGLMTILAGTASDGSAVEHRAYEFRVSADSLVSARYRDTPPLPSRGDLIPQYKGPGWMWVEPVAFDLEGDGEMDFFTPANTMGLYGWDTADASAKSGWPMILADVPFTPAVTEAGMVVADGDGAVHLLRLPDDAIIDADGWLEYGGRDQLILHEQYGWASNWGLQSYCHLGYLLPPIRPGGSEGAAPPGLSLRSPALAIPQELEFFVPAAGEVDLSVYDIRGRRIRQLVRDILEAGRQRVVWDGRDDRGNRAASGVYFYRLRRDGQKTEIRKTLILK